MLRQFSLRRITLFAIIDWAGTLTMLVCAGLLRQRIGYLPELLAVILRNAQIPQGTSSATATLTNFLAYPVFFMVALIWPFFLRVFSVYDGRRNETLKAELLNVFLAICVSVMTLAGALYFTYRETPRVLFLLFFVLDAALLLGSRILLWGYRRFQPGPHRRRRPGVIVIGAGLVGQQVAQELKRYACADMDLIGFVDDDDSKRDQQFGGLPVLGKLDQLPDLVTLLDVKGAVVALPLRAHERLVTVCKMLQSMDVSVSVVPDLFALSFPGARLDGFGGIPVIDLGRPGIHGLQRLSKRAFDVVAVSLGLALLSPLMLIVAVAIKLDSPGPVLYKQKRIGEHGREFVMYKFRSMKSGADTKVHQEYVTRLIAENLSVGQLGTSSSSLKLECDPRVTGVGRFIRKTSLDELPQLFNVLRGEMSLVGPRPPIPYEVEVYKDWHKRRLQAIPGITGLWQVKGRNRVSFDEMVRLDLTYIEQQSLWLDIKILAETPFSVMIGRGAG